MGRIGILLCLVLVLSSLLEPAAAQRRARRRGRRVNVQTRIVGGSRSTINRHPYVVSILSRGSHACGGALIKPNVVLTAGHCVTGQSGLSIRAGSDQLNSGGVVAEVSRTLIHPRFRRNPLNFDLALIYLKEPLTISSTIQTIPINTRSIPVGSTVTVSGWGKTAESSRGLSNSLRSVQLRAINRRQCRRVYGRLLASAEFCAGAQGKDSCQGDSGGPLVYNGRLAGVVSSGYGCGRRGFPGLYTRVAYLQNFINKNA